MLNQFGGKKISAGSIAGYSVLAFFIGLLGPLFTLFQVMMPMPALSIVMIAAVILYTRAGKIPAIVMGIACAASSVFVYGPVTGLASLLIGFVPAAVMMIGVHRKEGFFRQIARGVIVSVACTAAAVVLMALVYGSDMIKFAMDQVRATFESQQEMFFENLAAMYQMYGAEMTMENFVGMYYEMFNLMELYYEYYLLANLINGALVSSLISILWANWLIARYGQATTQSYRCLGEWYLNENTTFGILLTVLAAFIMYKLKVYGGESAWIIVREIATTVFLIQLCAAFDRRMKMGGAGYVRRAVMIVLLMVFGAMSGITPMLAVLGCASALFGSKGAAKPYIQKMKDKMDGEDS